MTRFLALVLLVGLSPAALADRITQMPPTELCVYTARLYVAGYYYYLQGKPRSEVKLHWHGDETQNEMDFVAHTIDDAYAMADAMKRADPEKYVSEQDFGDRAYEACMEGKRL